MPDACLAFLECSARLASDVSCDPWSEKNSPLPESLPRNADRNDGRIQDGAQEAKVSGVSKNRDYPGLLLRLMVSERPQGDEEGRWREPCTRCPLKRAQRWWEKRNTVHCGARVAQRSTHAWLQRLTHKHRRFQTRPGELTGENGEGNSDTIIV